MTRTTYREHLAARRRAAVALQRAICAGDYAAIESAATRSPRHLPPQRLRNHAARRLRIETSQRAAAANEWPEIVAQNRRHRARLQRETLAIKRQHIWRIRGQWDSQRAARWIAADTAHNRWARDEWCRINRAEVGGRAAADHWHKYRPAGSHPDPYRTAA